MFGNTIGWVISAIIAVLGGYGGYELMLVAQPTAPTGWIQSTIKPIGLADAATAALLPMTSPKDDAGDLYRQAAADYDRRPAVYADMQKTRDFVEPQINELKAFDLICQAATCSSMHLYSNHPEEIVGFNTNVDLLDKLGQVTAAMANVISLAKVESPPRYDIAERYAYGLAALGYNLYKERVAWAELDSGESFLGTGLVSLMSIEKGLHHDDKAQLAQTFDTLRTEEFKNAIEPVKNVLTSLGEQNIAIHAGDFLLLAQDPAADRVWRVEAIRKVGRLQFFSNNSADQRKAPKVLKKIAADSSEDLVIKTTAAKARDMTEYDNQGQR